MSILLSLQAVGSQAADQMPDLTAVTLPTEAEINVIDLAFKGGWIMVVLLLLSLMAIYIFVQRLIITSPCGNIRNTSWRREMYALSDFLIMVYVMVSEAVT